MKKLLSVLVLSMLLFNVAAQTSTDPVIFEIGGKQIHKSQFMKEFLRSIGKDPAATPTACTYEKRKALEEYVQLYVNFQAKLADAYSMGLDTSKYLLNELAVYRKDLAAPYLIDSATMMSLLREAYERNHYALHAAHILVPCQESAGPEDTLKAYNHAMELYQKALQNPDFYSIAQKEMYDQRIDNIDPLIREKATQVNPYEGDLGCFTVFDMIYAFESAVYSMKPGEIHAPVRSRYGYHIIKLFDRYPYYGKVQLAHIWVTDKDPNAQGKINSAYNQLNSGVDFATVCKNHSSDPNTAKEGGLMPELSCNQLPFEYVETIAKGLKVGEYSAPFKSRFGWHIIKLVKNETMPEFESLIPYYKSRMTRGERSTKPQHIFVEQCKGKYNFVDYTKVKTSKKKNAPYAASLDAVRAVVTDSIFSAIFNYDSNQITDMRPLFKIGDRQYNSRQFARHMYKNKTVYPICPLDIFVADRYNDFVEAMVLKYADDRLEIDNPEFGELIDEYRHGLMIFAYNDIKVWSRALKDSAGFEDFYNRMAPTHSYDDTNDAVYFWNHRARVNVVTIADSACLKPDKAQKIVNKAVAKGWSINDLEARLNEKVSKKACVAETPVAVELQVVEAGNQNLLTNNEWGKGVYTRPTEKGYQFLIVEQILQPELKSRDEARGYYLNDYQNYLEEQNNLELRKKYNVKIYQNVVDEITY
jgi:peptidyl-prolyl cis-trans isomerase SurA